MGYQDRLWKSRCAACKQLFLWVTAPTKGRWTCSKCQAVNRITLPSQWPEVPRTMYLGCDNNNLLKVLPFAPEHADEEWAQPYSVRSFVAQASVALQGCWYRCWRRGEV